MESLRLIHSKKQPSMLGKNILCVEKRYTNLKFKNKTIDFSLRYRYDGNVRFSITAIEPNQAENGMRIYTAGSLYRSER